MGERRVKIGHSNLLKNLTILLFLIITSSVILFPVSRYEDENVGLELTNFTILLFSMFFLVIGADWFLSASETIGRWLNFSPLIIGLVLVGFGTSLPELIVSHLAAFRGNGQLALGNILGSNIANIYLVLGIGLLISPISFSKRGFKKEFYFHFLATISFVFIAASQHLGIFQTIPLFCIFIAFIWSSLRSFFDKNESNIESSDESNQPAGPPSGSADQVLGLNHENSEKVYKSRKEIVKTFFKFISGMGLLFLGGEYLVISASKLATSFGVSDFVISAIVVAFGTSLPELITSLLAVMKKKNSDIIVGNIIGSNIFNLALVAGTLGVYNLKVDRDLAFEWSILLLASVSFLIVNKIKDKIFHRKTGVLMILIYIFAVYRWAF